MAKRMGGEIDFNHGASNASVVAILFPKSFTAKINEISRLFLLDISHNDWDMVICNISAPTKDKQNDQIEFLT